MVAQPRYDNLVSEISDALTLHYQKWVTKHSSDDIYAYVIYATPLVSNISTCVLTEQGLKQIASDYKTKYGYKETLDQLAIDLRWSVADTPYCGNFQELFAAINKRLEDMTPYVNSMDLAAPALKAHTNTLYAILVAVLNQFRQNTLGGTTRPMLYVDFGDMSDEERLMFIEQCNATELVSWYRTSIESCSCQY